ncbi:MAG: hypothetical protein ACE5R6_10215 [Candidatus Heimdallarchaeota archaeon]
MEGYEGPGRGPGGSVERAGPQGHCVAGRQSPQRGPAEAGGCQDGGGAEAGCGDGPAQGQRGGNC